LLSRPELIKEFWHNDQILETLDPGSTEYMQLLSENEKLAGLIVGVVVSG